MKERNTSDRLKEIMAKNGLRQIDILNKAIPFCKKYNVKLGRNDLSQYISGKVEPSQKKINCSCWRNAEIEWRNKQIKT